MCNIKLSLKYRNCERVAPNRPQRARREVRRMRDLVSMTAYCSLNIYHKQILFYFFFSPVWYNILIAGLVRVSKVNLLSCLMIKLDFFCIFVFCAVFGTNRYERFVLVIVLAWVFQQDIYKVGLQELTKGRSALLSDFAQTYGHKMEDFYVLIYQTYDDLNSILAFFLMIKRD